MPVSVTDIIQRANQLKPQKSNWDNRAQTAAKYCIPHKATITTKREEGAEVDTDVFDSTAIESSQIASAGLQAFLASASSRWFALKFKDKALQDDKEAQDWLREVEDGIYSILNSSNWNQSFGEFLHDLVVFPGATLYSEEDVRDIIRFKVIPFDEVFIGLNSRGDVDELFRMFQYDVKQCIDRWGDKNSSEVLELYKNKKLEVKVDIIHAVGERHQRNVSKKDSLNMEFYECFIDVKNKKKLEEKGYLEFPYSVGRWRVNGGQTWGYSPAISGTADILMLNEMSKVYIQSAQLDVAPPWLFPDENFVLPLDFNAHAINFRTQNIAAQSASERDPFPLVTPQKGQIAIDMFNRQTKKVENMFYKDLFLPLLEKTATAFEVAKVIEKRMTILGSVIGGIQRSTLEPIIMRTFNIGMRLPKSRRVFPDPPPQVRGKLEVDYVSPLAIAQKSVLNQTVQAFMADVGQMAMIDPTVKHKVNWANAVDELSTNYGINPKLLNSKQVFEDLVQAEMQMQAQAMALQAAGAGAKAYKDGADGAKSASEAQNQKKAA